MSSVKDELEAMIAGTHKYAEIEDEGVNEEDVETEEETAEEVDESEETTEETDVEDTDQEDEVESEDDTEDDDQETSEDENDESEEEDAQTDSEESNETEEDEVEPNQETEESTESQDEIDYKAFYEKVALAKFTANGKEVEGFKDPDDLIRAQQMLHGYSDKMKVFKEYKKFLIPLQKRKITEDPDKFNLAMSLLDGDIEAIKTVLKEKDINPMDMDLDDIKFTPKNVLPSDAQLTFEEIADQAKQYGVQDKFYQAVNDDFDDVSFKRMLETPVIRNNLINQLSDGTYDKVKAEMRNLELLDSTGQYSNLSTIEKYDFAANKLYREFEAAKAKEAKNTEAERIAKEKAEAEYKKKVEAKEKAAEEARQKAAAASKPKKTVKKTQKKEVRPEALKGDEFRDYFKSMLM